MREPVDENPCEHMARRQLCGRDQPCPRLDLGLRHAAPRTEREQILVVRVPSVRRSHGEALGNQQSVSQSPRRRAFREDRPVRDFPGRAPFWVLQFCVQTATHVGSPLSFPTVPSHGQRVGDFYPSRLRRQDWTEVTDDGQGAKDASSCCV